MSFLGLGYDDHGPQHPGTACAHMGGAPMFTAIFSDDGTKLLNGALCRESPTPDAVKLLEILQGKWLGHPLHAAIVHVPVGSWTAACLLDIAHRAQLMTADVGRLATYCVGFGLVGALLAVAPGIADWLPIKKEKPAWKLGLYHMLLNVLALIVWAANFYLRLQSDSVVTDAILGTSVIGTLLVFVSGYLGSLMVFDQGTSVARQSKKEWREIAREGGSRVPEEK